MASIASSCRISARAATQNLRRHHARRAFRTASRALAAQNFAMPALSPTMTEGNIASWGVKEGDSFSAGDVILEVETDKATMDVEAQDDGVLAKILQPDGSKAVKVGSRIAVLAEPGDDLSSLEIPPDDSASSSAGSQADHQPEAAPSEPPTPEPEPRAESPQKTSAKSEGQKYPLYPSVAFLLHTHNLSADDIPATGPNGRLLKGDVLAYLKEIPTSYPKELSSRLSKLSHLDLSNVKPAAPPPPPPAAAPEAPKKDLPPPPPPRVLTTPISLAAVLAVQKRLHDILGVTMPLSAFIGRAVDLANEDLPPAPRAGPPSADELFEAIVAPARHVRAAPLPSRGHFVPQIVAHDALSPLQTPRSRRAAGEAPHKRDLFDDIVAAAPSSRQPHPPPPLPLLAAATAAPSSAGAENIFSLAVDRADEKRATVFLQRVKAVLELEPGRLVL